MKTTAKSYYWIVWSLIHMVAITIHAETVFYSLDNVILDDSKQMTGIFSWTYDIGDFENGVGQFLSLDIPWSAHNQDDLISTIEPAQIEITFDGNVHDDGVDIKLVLLQPFAPATPSLINTNTTASKYSIGGNKFHDGFFLSGSISPTNLVLNIISTSPGLVSLSWGTGFIGYILQETPSLFTNWTDSASGSTNPIIVPALTPMMF